jgi:hypothetical protein
VPIDLTELKTKSGHPVLRASFLSEVTVAEARAYHQQISSGGKYDGWGHIAAGNVSGVSSEVRKVLSSQRPDPLNPPPVAVILSSALARMAASLAMRMSDNANTDSFKNETEALAWLDERMGVFLAKRCRSNSGLHGASRGSTRNRLSEGRSG